MAAVTAVQGDAKGNKATSRVNANECCIDYGMLCRIIKLFDSGEEHTVVRKSNAGTISCQREALFKEGL
jgi:hypothetical protein